MAIKGIEAAEKVNGWGNVESYEYIFIYLFIVFQNPYTGVRPMDIGIVKE